LGNAFLEVQSLIEPGKRNLVEIRQEEAVEEDDQGEPPDSAMRSTSKESKKRGTPMSREMVGSAR
jgi:hypothetical protein